MQQTDLNTSPFYDDFDETKNFHRILFRPNRTVQTRELIQAQTILQSQIDRLGRHFFDEGSAVIPGGLSTKVDQDTIKVQINGTIDASIFDDYKGKIYIRSISRDLEAKVLMYKKASGSNDPAAFAVEYVKSDLNGGSNKFTETEPCILFIRGDNGDTDVISLTVTSPHKGLLVTVMSGVYFVRGHFVLSKEQTHLASPFDNTVSVRCGFLVGEEIVDEAKDPSLLSNANGYPNYKAPGASRFKMTLTLSSLLDGEKNGNFVEIVRFQEGQVQKKVETTTYSIVERAIAERIYETNGDYVAKDYPISVYQHLKDEYRPDGLYTAALGGDESKLVVRLGSGVGYARGYRSEITGFEDILVEKARDTRVVNNATMLVSFGSYLIVNSSKSLPPLDPRNKVLLLAADGITQVGYCRVRSIKREDSNSLRIFIFDVNMNAGKTFSADAKKVKFTNSSNLFTADISGSAIFDSSADSSVFRLPYPCAKSMTGLAGPDTSFSVVRTYDVTLNDSGVGSITLPAGELFKPIDNYNYAISLTGASNVGTNFVPTSSLTLGGTPAGRTLNINLGSGQAAASVRILVSVNKSTTTPKVKTLRTSTIDLVFTNESKKTLPNADIYSVDSVINMSNNLDETKLFGFFDGQRPNWYENGVLILKSGKNVNVTYRVTYSWFEHSMGDYFNVDSYGGLAREFIPTTSETADRTLISLADCLDFRPLKDGSGDVTPATFNGDMVDPSDAVRFDLTYYLDRIDAIYLNQNGEYGVAKGIPSDNPTVTNAPANSMKLFDLLVPAYTADVTKVTWKRIDNRRYTMRDIGALDNRITNLEYYTTLNMLESKISQTQVIDPTTGANRFKNGFMADGFSDLKMSDILDPEWSASIDPSVVMLRSPYSESGSDLSIISGTNHHAGDMVCKSYTHKEMIVQPYATSTININPYAVFTWAGHVTLNPSTDFWKDVNYLSPIVINETYWLTGQSMPPSGTFNRTPVPVFGPGTSPPTSRAGSWWNSVTTVVSRETTKWVDTISSSIIPYMRSINISFTLDGFKPFTRLYPFFNGTNVSAFSNQTGKAKGEPIITDSKGRATGVFTVPNTTTDRFPTGEGVLRFTDMPNNENSVESETSGETKFISGGTYEVARNMTRNVTVMRQDWVYRPPVDPIAQTFFNPESGGSFISKIDLFFATKAANAPVVLQIRRVENGIPTSKVVGGGQVILYPDSVVTSNNGSLPTSFVFKDPVYLEGDGEYAFVLLADTQEYNVWRAVMGENLTNREVALSKQPYIGVLLSSSNAKTWTPHQLEDLKFTIYRASFDTASDTVVTLGSTAPQFKAAPFNAFDTVSGSNQIKLRLRGHGLKAGDNFSVEGAVGGNGLTDSEFNGVKTVVDYDINGVTFTASTNATATGTVGGDNIIVNGNTPFTEFISSIRALNYGESTIKWEMNYLIQSSRVASGWIQFNNDDEVVALVNQGVVKAAGDLQIRATLKSSNEKMSPFFDLQGCGLNLIARRINQDVNDASFCYVTRSIKFDNPSTSARFWVSTLLPGDNVVRLFVKPMATGDENLSSKAWTEVLPTKPIINNSTDFQEYEFQYNSTGSPFVGFKVKVAFLGSDPCATPTFGDFRSVALS